MSNTAHKMTKSKSTRISKRNANACINVPNFTTSYIIIYSGMVS